MTETNPEFKAELVAADGGRIELHAEHSVGRSADCDITIDDSQVSRRHALIRVDGESVSVEDLGSANGTSVNKLRIQGKTMLVDGDVLQFDENVFSVAITGIAQEEEADLDATVVKMPTEDDDATVVKMPESRSAPMPEPASPVESAPTVDLPGSWVDGDDGNYTQVLATGDLGAGSGSAGTQIERMSDAPHLVVLDTSGAAVQAMELDISGEGSNVWEIGREPSCEIQLDEPSVSGRHAQLVHDDGRWRLVNLVSANGIFVNGEKRLSAFLADGDEIRLGRSHLVFRTAEGASQIAAASGNAGASTQAPEPTAKSKTRLILVAGVIFVGAVVGASLLL